MSRRYALCVAAGLLPLAGCADPPEAAAPPAARPPAPPPEPPAPAEPMFEVTPEAETQLLRFAGEAKLGAGWMVRLRSEPGGCTGLKNYLDLEPNPPSVNDATHATGRVVFVYSRPHRTIVQGARVDYVAAGCSRGFTVTYPNKTAANQELTRKWIDHWSERLRAERGSDPEPAADQPPGQP